MSQGNVLPSMISSQMLFFFCLWQLPGCLWIFTAQQLVIYTPSPWSPRCRVSSSVGSWKPCPLATAPFLCLGGGGFWGMSGCTCVLKSPLKCFHLGLEQVKPAVFVNTIGHFLSFLSAPAFSTVPEVCPLPATFQSWSAVLKITHQ